MESPPLSQGLDSPSAQPHHFSTEQEVSVDTSSDPLSSVELQLKASSKLEQILIIDWDGPNDPDNPKKWVGWTKQRKWAVTAILSAFAFITPVSSSMVAPAVGQITKEFGIHSSFEAALTVSVFVLAYAFGPLFLGPLSEIFGRAPVVHGSNIFFIAWNLACAFAQNENQLIAFRFLAGLGGSAPLTIGGGTISDAWAVHERGQAIALYFLAPLLGPVIGPVAGAWIAEKSNWRWVFRSTSIIAGVIHMFGLFFLEETFAPVILERKARKVRRNIGDACEKGTIVRTTLESDERQWKHIFSQSIFRSFLIVFQEPIIQLFGLYMAFIYGIIYLLTTLPNIFLSVYGESIGIAGLHYIAFGLGMVVCSQVNAKALDRIHSRLSSRNGGIGRPEFRLPPMFVGSALVPTGLLLTGWAIEEKLHWIIIDIGLSLLGGGLIINWQAISVYTVDCFAIHAASALAAISCFRSLAGFGFPLFAPTMYTNLGYGVSNTILAAAGIAIGWPAVWAFWTYGQSIRGMSRRARKDGPRNQNAAS